MKLLRAAAGLICLLLPLAVAAQAPLQSAVEQVAIGAPGERMALAIWRPAGTATASTGFPLVVISHGTGAGPTAHSDTAEALAAAGFVVAAPMHRGDNFQDDSLVGRPQWMASRSRDVTTTIDYMLKQWPKRAQLDQSRIGIFGFSAGGTTALIAAGGVPDLERLGSHCAAQREFVCVLVAPAAGAGAQAPEWTHDPRITAAVVAAPGLGFLFEPAGLAGVRVPVQLWVGSEDDVVPYETNAAVVRRLLPSSPEFHRAEGAVHLSFLAPCTAETPPMLCRDREGFDRSAFHRSFNEAVTSFFRRNLSKPSRRKRAKA